MPMSSINRVVLVGNLTRDPELRELGSSGNSVCHLRIACNGRRKAKDGNWEDRSHYFDVSVFGPQAENTNKYLRKGKPVAIDGRLEWREWESDGHGKRQSVSIVADSVQFLGTPDPRPTDDATTGVRDQVPHDSDGAAQSADRAGFDAVAVAAGGVAGDTAIDDAEDREDLTF